jgi:nucleotide-binding universal stress UspA family protein
MVRVGHCDDHLSGYEDPRTSLTRPWLVPDLAEHVRDRVAKVDGDVQRVLAHHPDVPAEVVSWRGRPPRVLADESRNAALVVVGARGLGGFAELMLGSVSSEVLHWARCPVAVVR